MRLLAVATLGVLAAACHRKAPNGTSPDASPNPTADAAPMQPAASANDADERARRLVNTWSDALDRHDVGALEGLYAERVRYYGSDVPRSAVLHAKRAALGPKSTFHQQIVGKISLGSKDDGAVEATFSKRSGSADKTATVRAKLVLRAADAGSNVIVEETDEVTESRTQVGREACEAAAAKATNDLSAVKRITANTIKAAEKAGGRQNFGGVGPIDDDNGGFSAGLGTHTEDRFEGLVWYAVDRNGKLTVTVLGEEQKMPADALRAVEAACKH